MDSQNFENLNSELKLRAVKINNIINWIAVGLGNDQIKVKAPNLWKLSELQIEVLLTQAQEQLLKELPRPREERLTALLAQAHLICQAPLESQECLMALDRITFEIESLLPAAEGRVMATG